ncbi:MAG: S4 domain-containing protein YaaA [Tissierellia bacterium]|nr:S4 domain-containing protein YaaA [Tissierellia bacterium]
MTNEIKIDTEFIKLEQLLKLASIVDSGGIAKMIIQDELIKVNGEIETRRGRKLYPGDIVEYQGEIFFIK